MPNTKRALVIEDNENNMELISFILSASGYEVLKAENGLAGVLLARDQLPDFILLDIQLPDISGDDVIARIRADEKTRAIPVIAMTSYSMTGDRERLLQAGCDGYIEKPINPSRVVDQIESVI
ncbi:MAG: response regulator [Candidatus Sedimenticola sp. 20ELBAFRAG]